MEKIKIVIANGSELVREGLKGLISSKKQFIIVAEVLASADLQKVLSEISVDVLMIDQTSKGFDVDDIRRCKQIAKRTRCLAITPEQSAQALLSAIRAGVSGYVKIDCSKEEILDAIVATAHGRKFFCGQILEVIRSSSLEFDILNIGELTCDPVVLSDRELEVIKLIAEGQTNGQIADKLFLSSHTINAHRRNVMQKLGVNNTASVVMFAVKEGLVSPNKYLFSADPQA